MKLRRLRLAGLCLIAAAAAACTSSPGGITWATGAGSQTHDGLQRVRWSDLGALYLTPGADFQGFRSILLAPLKIAPASPDGERRAFMPSPTYPPTPEYLEQMAGLYRDAFTRELGGRFALVSEPGPGVLQLSGYVLDLILTARLDPQNEAREADIVRGFGELTLVLDARDAANGAPLLRAIDRQAITRDPMHGAVVNSVGANIEAQREMFERQAVLLGTRLQELQQTPALPAAPAAPR